MGCDLHLHIEVKINGKWEHYSHPKIQRNYGLFSKMANVRNEDSLIVPICDPKDLPEDLSLITRMDYNYDGEGSHSASWFNKKEIKHMCDYANTNCSKEWSGDWEHTQLGYANGNAFYTIGNEDGGHPKEYEDVRFVFWFDN